MIRAIVLFLAAIVALLTFILIGTPAYAVKPCTVKVRIPDGPGGFLLKNADHGGIVALLPQELPDAKRVTIHRRVKRCRNNNTCSFYRKRARLESTGRANGDREHWRDRGINLKDLPPRRVTIRAVLPGDPDPVIICFNIARLDPERND
jgi:hypothetical protein